MRIPTEPVFESRDFLQLHIHSILEFYEPRVVSPEGGFNQGFLDNGEIFDSHSRQLVGSSRFVFNYATAYRLQGNAHYLDWARWGLKYLTAAHLQPSGHYAWLLEKDQVTDGRALAYGHAFVMLAAASCTQIGIESAEQTVNKVWEFLEQYFWDKDHEAYADERDNSLVNLDPYRGQNANMHLCEALLAAWQATHDPRFLDRAELLAKRFALDMATQSDGLIWEHYNRDWQVDLQFNRDKPNDRYKPWSFSI